ncbi:MAG TPA: alpha/beta hydrolase-fold protein [Terriglobales bacterium]|nr:alpha/beta hydrolase-fold protein [Terriglobales bacterium]
MRLRVIPARLLLVTVLVVLGGNVLATAQTAAAGTGLRFEISFPRQANATPLDGRILLLISNNDRAQPRFQISGENPVESQQMFGVDVEGLAPGTAAVVDSSTLGYPAESLNKVPAGDYWVQGLINIYETFHLANGHTVKLPPDKGEGQHWQVKPGNLYSRPLKVHLDPNSAQMVRITLSEKIPPVEEEAQDVYAILDGWVKLPEEPIVDNKWVKHLRIQSKLLSQFWGRPMYLGAIVLLPEGWEEHPNARYPLVVQQTHFHRDISEFAPFRTQPPPAGIKDPEAQLAAKYGYKFFQDWTAGRLPRVIILQIQHANPYFDDSYAVNSANLGPYGDAITQELIPYIEQKFRAIGQGWARAVFGGSTGGWEALSSQVFYPDFYNGAWVFCPDVVDFRAYVTTNLYDDENAYFVEGPYGRVERPGARKPDGLVLSTMEQNNRYELVLGTKSRSGDQFDIWQAVFSPAGDDGYPKEIYDQRTGKIDHEVAAYWRDHYDLSHILQRDWKTLGPKLAGKMHFYVGEADTYYLDRATHLLHDFLENTNDPYYHGTFDFGMRRPHCYTGGSDPNQKVNNLTTTQRVLPEMVEHMEKTAPKEADVKSWKY